ncbi:hypothetical protein CALCODRAFT_316127 [Calocera cornea HHB12733]|uniref:SGNH hydrolase-type esterase domain-containing protein n=1 Tax=Calocera cornea HHB12733 TaxID=1353952 RepID=A0A165FAJ2_9BASI|nr:hypothetical protein CALCODRAFT_316127 [Calocera cornea HHB12733]
MALVNVLDSPDISWQGRWSASHPHTSAWGASVILFKTSAPNIVLKTGAGSKGFTVTSIRFGKIDEPCVICSVWRVGHGEIQRREIKGAQEVVLSDEAGSEERVVELVFGEIGGHLEIDSLLISETHTLVPVFAPSPTPPLRLLFIGASQTSGFSTPFHTPPVLPSGSFTSWPLIFTRTLREEDRDVRTTVVARPGIRLCSGLVEGEEVLGMDRRFWEGWDGVGGFGGSVGGAEADKGEVVFISIGSNDMATGVSQAEYLSGLQRFLNALVSRLSPHVKHLVFVAPFGFHTRSAGGSWARQGVFEPQTKDMLDALSDEWEERGYAEQVWHCDTAGWVNGDRCPDGLHFDEQGHGDVARRLREWCEAHLGDVF